MSHRALDEIAELEAQLRELDAGIVAAKVADVVDFKLIIEARARRARVVAWLEQAKEAVAQ